MSGETCGRTWRRDQETWVERVWRGESDFPRNRNNPQALRSFAPILETEPGRSPLRGSFIDRVAIGRNVRGFSLNTFSER